MFCLSEEYKYRLFETFFDIPAIVCCARIVDVLDEEVYILYMLLFFHYFIKHCSIITLCCMSILVNCMACYNVSATTYTGIATQKQTFFLFLFFFKERWDGSVLFWYAFTFYKLKCMLARVWKGNFFPFLCFWISIYLYNNIL